MHDAMNFKIKYLDENIEILEYFLTLPLSPQVRRATQAKIENLKRKRMQRIKYLERCTKIHERRLHLRPCRSAAPEFKMGSQAQQ